MERDIYPYLKKKESDVLEEEIPEWRKQLMIETGCWKTNQIFYFWKEPTKGD
jgi:hypothetical protein